MRWIALNRREWPKVAPNKTPFCTDRYSSRWLEVYYDNELLNGSGYGWGTSANDPDSWKSSKSISHMDLWMLWIQVLSPPPALQHKSLEQYVIWTTAPQWSVEPDDGLASISLLPLVSRLWIQILLTNEYATLTLQTHWWLACCSICPLARRMGACLTWCVILALHILL